MHNTAYHVLKILLNIIDSTRYRQLRSYALFFPTSKSRQMAQLDSSTASMNSKGLLQYMQLHQVTKMLVNANIYKTTCEFDR